MGKTLQLLLVVIVMGWGGVTHAEKAAKHYFCNNLGDKGAYVEVREDGLVRARYLKDGSKVDELFNPKGTPQSFDDGSYEGYVGNHENIILLKKTSVSDGSEVINFKFQSTSDKLAGLDCAYIEGPELIEGTNINRYLRKAGVETPPAEWLKNAPAKKHVKKSTKPAGPKSNAKVDPLVDKTMSDAGTRPPPSLKDNGPSFEDLSGGAATNSKK